MMSLNPKDPLFPQGKSGALHVEARDVMGKDGKLYRYNWVFGERGIGHLLAKLKVDDDGTQDAGDDLAAVMNGTQLDQDGEKHDLGTIKVILTRVTDAKLRRGRHACVPDYEEDETDEVDMTYAEDVEHTARYNH